MAYRKVGSIGEFKEFKEKGDFAEGLYVKLHEDFGINKSKVYTLKQSDGNEINVWGSTALDDKMKQVVLNSQIKIEYSGDKKSVANKKDYHVFDVYVDDAVKPNLGTNQENLEDTDATDTNASAEHVDAESDREFNDGGDGIEDIGD